jgi:hypothetical protein
MSYAVAGYLITALVLLLYVLRVLRRGRALARTLPPGERTWQ